VLGVLQREQVQETIAMLLEGLIVGVPRVVLVAQLDRLMLEEDALLQLLNLKKELSPMTYWMLEMWPMNSIVKSYESERL
jgi:hypothetical protein